MRKGRVMLMRTIWSAAWYLLDMIITLPYRQSTPLNGMAFKPIGMQETFSAHCTFKLFSALRYVKPKMCDSEAALGRTKGKGKLWSSAVTLLMGQWNSVYKKAANLWRFSHKIEMKRWKWGEERSYKKSGRD